MSGKTLTIPQSVPKFEAELVREEYASFAERTARCAPEDGDEVAADGRGAFRLSADERREFRARLRDAGVSEESVEGVAFGG